MKVAGYLMVADDAKSIEIECIGKGKNFLFVTGHAEIYGPQLEESFSKNKKFVGNKLKL